MDRILSDVDRIILKFMNLQVTKMDANNGTFYGNTNVDTVVTKCFHD